MEGTNQTNSENTLNLQGDNNQDELNQLIQILNSRYIVPQRHPIIIPLFGEINNLMDERSILENSFNNCFDSSEYSIFSIRSSV